MEVKLFRKAIKTREDFIRIAKSDDPQAAIQEILAHFRENPSRTHERFGNLETLADVLDSKEEFDFIEQRPYNVVASIIRQNLTKIPKQTAWFGNP